MKLEALNARLRRLIEHDKLWTAVSAMSGAVAAIMAFLSIQQARDAARESRLATRPQFQMSAERIDGAPPQLRFTFKNVGGRAATDCDLLAIVLSASLQASPVLSESVSLAHDVEASADYRFTAEKPLDGTIPAGRYFVVVGFAYRDAIVGTRLRQIRVLRWSGHGKDPELGLADRGTRDRVVAHLHDALKGFVEP